MNPEPLYLKPKAPAVIAWPVSAITEAVHEKRTLHPILAEAIARGAMLVYIETLSVETFGGWLLGLPGHYVVHSAGRFYICSPQALEEHYEGLEDPPVPTCRKCTSRGLLVFAYDAHEGDGYLCERCCPEHKWPRRPAGQWAPLVGVIGISVSDRT